MSTCNVIHVCKKLWIQKQMASTNYLYFSITCTLGPYVIMCNHRYRVLQVFLFPFWEKETIWLDHSTSLAMASQNTYKMETQFLSGIKTQLGWNSILTNNCPFSTLNLHHILSITLEISAKNKGQDSLQATTSINFFVLDVNDNPPTFFLNNYDASILENAPVGSPVITMVAGDLDASPEFREVKYFSN